MMDEVTLITSLQCKLCCKTLVTGIRVGATYMPQTPLKTKQTMVPANPDHTGSTIKTTQVLPKEGEKELKVSTWPYSSPDPNLIEH